MDNWFFESIDIKYYTPLYYFICLIIVISILLHSQTTKLFDPKSIRGRNFLGVFFLLFVVLYMGLRPIHGVFVDMGTYANAFNRVKNGYESYDFKDPIFELFLTFCGKFLTVDLFFLICAILYIGPLYLVSVKLFERNWFYAFFAFAISFSFWAYGVNGIRNGIAGSIFLLGITRSNNISRYTLILIAIGFHLSMLLPAIGFLSNKIITGPKKYLSLWVSCIFLSIFFGGYWEQFFTGIGINDNRISYLTDTSHMHEFSRAGYRWDFLLYGSFAVFIGNYFIYRLNFTDKSYFMLYNIYVFSNAIWILINRASFSNRFAYLSWFMMALVIFYPLVSRKIITNQHKVLGGSLLIYFLFTFIMNVVL